MTVLSPWLWAAEIFLRINDSIKKGKMFSIEGSAVTEGIYTIAENQNKESVKEAASASCEKRKK